MEFKTCEEYVLARLERFENENEELKDKIVEQSLTIGRLVAKEHQLNDTIDVLLGLFKSGGYGSSEWWESTVYRSDDVYKVIENLKKEREPNSEENDSQNNVSEL